jgi:hypothetical protein
MNSTFADNLLKNEAFLHFPSTAQVHVLAQLEKWKELSMMPTVTKDQMILYKNNIIWEIAIDYFKNIPLEAIVIKKRSVALYVVFNYYNLPENLVRKKFLRNKTFHDRVGAVAIWYSSPELRHIIESVFGSKIIFNINNYTSYTFVRHRDAIYKNLKLLQQYSDVIDIPKVLFQSHDDLSLSISTGDWYGCVRCLQLRPRDVGCKHFPTVKYIKQHQTVCRCGKLHS